MKSEAGILDYVFHRQVFIEVTIGMIDEARRKRMNPIELALDAQLAGSDWQGRMEGLSVLKIKKAKVTKYFEVPTEISEWLVKFQSRRYNSKPIKFEATFK